MGARLRLGQQPCLPSCADTQTLPRHRLPCLPPSLLLALQAQEEVFKARLAALKREEEALRQELARLEVEKVAYIR